jgi:hypothetical protein
MIQGKTLETMVFLRSKFQIKCQLKLVPILKKVKYHKVI